MEAIIFVVLLALVLAFVVHKTAKKDEIPPETYVCDICGEDVCICHKENVDIEA